MTRATRQLIEETKKLEAGPFYARRDIESLGALYIRHVEAMTAEQLHSKSDIAGELAQRDHYIAALLRVIDEQEAVLSELPKSADGITLSLNREVFVNHALAKQYHDPGYGRGPRDFVYENGVFSVVVVAVGCLGDPYRAASFIEHGMSFSISIDLRAVFSTEAAALQGTMNDVKEEHA